MPVYTERVPEWIRAGRFFASPRAKEPENYARIDFGVMGNILFRAPFLRHNGVRFDDRFGLIGGEDRKVLHGPVRAGRRLRLGKTLLSIITFPRIASASPTSSVASSASVVPPRS